MKFNPLTYRPHLHEQKLKHERRRLERQGLIERPVISAANSNTRILSGSPNAYVPTQVMSRPLREPVTREAINIGLNSTVMRQQLVRRLKQQGICHPAVLQAMGQVPRHVFVDEGLASRAYEDATLPIGFGQTISQPLVVARMISLALGDEVNVRPQRVLEVGAGCGYQTAILDRIFSEVYAIERIRGLYELALMNLSHLSELGAIHLHFGDGLEGWPEVAPFDAIIVAAAGLSIPPTLLGQLRVGGRLVAPVGGDSQRLMMWYRESEQHWQEHVLEETRFVPLLSGVQH